MSWSPAQEQAIVSRKQNLLLSAAAGSGKTAVLVERIIRRLLDDSEGVDINRLLVVTFTKAAAAEMRERIGKALAAARETGAKRRHIERQLALINSASISTLHSFCQSVIKQYFYRLELDPSFRLGSEAEMAMLKADTLEEVFERLYEADDAGFYRLVGEYGSDRGNDLLAGLVLRLHNFARSNPWPENWLDKLPTAFAVDGQDIDATPWSGLIREKLAFELEQTVMDYEALLAKIGQPGQPIVYRELFERECEGLKAALDACRMSWRDTATAMRAISFARLPNVRKDEVDDWVKKPYQDARKAAKDVVNGALAIFFARTPQELMGDMREALPSVRALADLTLDFHRRFQRLKREKNLLDFNDLEHFCLAILSDAASTEDNLIPSAAALELQERFAEVMVDEYQDTNNVQEAILLLVSRNNNRFMVGDVKQSIYRFRLAEPGLFMAKYGSYEQDAAACNRRIDLAHNFRSEAGILHAVNFLFARLMTKAAAEMDYGEKEALNPGLPYPTHENSVVGAVELLLINRDKEESEPGEEQGAMTDAEEELTRFEQEAVVIAERMTAMMEEGRQVYDKKRGWRPIAWRDMVVLLRATSGKSGVMLDILRQFGIPAYADEETGYFQAVEVEVMRSLLAVIDNPRQDIPLAGAMRSPLFGFSAAELAQIRQADNGCLWEAVSAAGLANANTAAEDDFAARILRLVSQIEMWRKSARRRGVAELIWQLYRDTGYYDYVGGLAGGVVRQANLRALFDRAREYEKTNYRGLFRFLRFIERLVDGGGDMAIARALGEGEDVVRIMSVHKSKGLEFPVVFMADLGKQFNQRDLTDKVLLHKSLGVGLYRNHEELRFSFPTLPWHGIAHRLMMEGKAEELRILYVALTRAREKLIMVGSVAKTAQSCERWSRVAAQAGRTLPDSHISTARTPLDWIVPVIMRHPDGAPLREAAGGEEVTLAEAENSHWNVKIINAATISLAGESRAKEHEWFERVGRLECVPTDVPPWLDTALSWEYECQAAVGAPAKLSVSEIKNKLTQGDEEAAEAAWVRPVTAIKPSFVRSEKRGFTAAERGTILHMVMQRLELNELHEDGIKRQIEAMVAGQIIRADEAQTVDVKAIVAFADSPLGQRLQKADIVRREMAFSMLLPAEQIYPELSGKDEKIFVQGIADCVFADKDGIVLLDYKTDKAPVGELIERYKVQLQLYATALERVLKKPINEVYIYGIWAGESGKVDTNNK